MASGAALVLALGQPVAQGALPDASCGDGSSPDGSTPLSSGDRAAQTFTAIHTGTVAGADMLINKQPGAGDFQLQILGVDGSGIPLNGPLATVTIPDASVPTGQTPLSGTFPEAPSVTAGKTYALAATRVGGPFQALGSLLVNCPGNGYTSTGGPSGSWSSVGMGFDYFFHVFVNPPSAFSIGKLVGRKLHLTVPGPGAIAVADDTPAPGAVPAAAGKLLRPSRANAAAAGDAVVKLRLTKRGRSLLRQKSKLKVRAEITYTPTGGDPGTRRTRLKLKR